MSSTKRRGFTLVELLVVIGIIALLISILLPSLARARKAANMVACGSNLKQVGMAIAMYQTDNKGAYPYCSIQFDGWHQVTWDDLLNAYWGGDAPQDDSWPTGIYGSTTLRGIKIIRCPEDVYELTRPVWALNYTQGSGQSDAIRSYTMATGVWNDNGFDNYAGAGAHAWQNVVATRADGTRWPPFDGQIINPNFRAMRPKDFPDSAGTIVLTEHFQGNVAGHSSQAMMNRPSELWPQPTAGLPDIPHTNGRRNCLFADGHVEALTVPEMGVNISGWGNTIGGKWTRKAGD